MTAPSLVERVAIEIAAESDDVWEYLPEQSSLGRDHYLDMARAAISMTLEAMEEPSEEMMLAMAEPISRSGEKPEVRKWRRGLWIAMLAAFRQEHDLPSLEVAESNGR